MAGIRKIALQQMKKSIYNWRPLHLDAYLSVVYMSSHLLSNYAVWYSIMSEVLKFCRSQKLVVIRI